MTGPRGISRRHWSMSPAMKSDHPEDPKGLILEAYRMEGIGAPECRTIFLDWAMSLPEPFETQAAIRKMLAVYGAGAEDHPMTQVLRDGLTRLTTAPRRRGGWRARARN